MSKSGSCSDVGTMTVPIPQAYFIWYCAWLSVPSAIYAYMSPPTTTHLAIIPASVFVTSILYWRNPIRNSWRRKLDMVTVTIGVSYQTYYAFGSIQYNSLEILTYIILIGFSAGLYIISNYLMKCGRLWLAAYTHASIHIVANIANIVLYNSIENTKNNKYII